MLNGKPVLISHPQQAINLGLAMVTEDRKRFGLFQNLNARQNISISSLDKISTGPLLSHSNEKHACQKMIEQLQIKLEKQRSPMHSLSGGNQQKCIIGRSLLTRPQVLLLDDPTRGVDVGAKAEIYRFLKELAAQDIAILMCSSELPELLLNCDRILVLCEGELTGNFSAPEATEESIMAAAIARKST